MNKSGNKFACATFMGHILGTVASNFSSCIRVAFGRERRRGVRWLVVPICVYCGKNLVLS